MIIAEPIVKDIDSQDDDPDQNDRAIALGLFGKFKLEEGVASGKFVSFMIDENDGNISDFMLRSNVEMIQLFEYLAIDGYELGNNEVKVTGSILKVGKSPLSMKVHDNPTGMIQIKNDGVEMQASMLLADGLGASSMEGDDGTTNVVITGLGVRGVVFIDNGTVNVDESNYGVYLNITIAPVDHLLIRFHPMIGERNGDMEDSILEGLSEGVIGGEVSISTDDDGVDYESIAYEPSFGLKVKEAEDERLVIEVSSSAHNGMVIALNIDKEALSDSGDVIVRINGEDVPQVEAAQVIDMAVSSDQDAKCAVAETDGMDQVLVYIPSFSVNDIEIVPSSLVEKTYGAAEWAIALVGAVAVLGLAGYMVIRRY